MSPPAEAPLKAYLQVVEEMRANGQSESAEQVLFLVHLKSMMVALRVKSQSIMRQPVRARIRTPPVSTEDNTCVSL